MLNLIKKIPKTLPYGKLVNRMNLGGILLGGKADQGGILSVPR